MSLSATYFARKRFVRNSLWYRSNISGRQRIWLFRISGEDQLLTV